NYVLNGKLLSGGSTPAPPSISVADVTIAEGNSGTKNATFTVTLSAPTTSTVTVNYATHDGSISGASATAGSDYTATSGKLTFTAGQTSKTVNVAVLGDAVFESDETFYLDLSAAVGATLARGTATGTIANDDTPPPPPNNSGSTLPATITFTNTNDWTNGFN